MAPTPVGGQGGLLRNGIWGPLRNGITRGLGMGCSGAQEWVKGAPEEWGVPVICSPLSAVYVPLLLPIPLLESAAECFPGVALPLIVSWQCNGDSGLVLGLGTSFPSPGPRFSRSRTLRADPTACPALVGALEVFSSALGSPPCSGKHSCLIPVISIVCMDPTSCSPPP